MIADLRLTNADLFYRRERREFDLHCFLTTKVHEVFNHGLYRLHGFSQPGRHTR